MAKAINQVNQVVQQNSSISEETLSASEELKSQALNMQKTIQSFKLKDEVLIG
jgi:methyl-accepting chemotaxis protein